MALVLVKEVDQLDGPRATAEVTDGRAAQQDVRTRDWVPDFGLETEEMLGLPY